MPSQANRLTPAVIALDSGNLESNAWYSCCPKTCCPNLGVAIMTQRIVSLLPSATEIVAALGYGDCLVGRSHACDFPDEVERVTVCSEPRVNLHGSSEEIDRTVRESVHEALSIYRVFDRELTRLQPTLIITQSQCDVCAVDLAEVEAAVERMLGAQPRIISLRPMELSDIWANIRSVAEVLGPARRGTELVAHLKQRLTDLSHQIPRGSIRPRVACIEWLDPLMCAGNWIPELVELAGGESVLGEAGQHSPWMSWEDLQHADPDVIILMPCGFDMARTLREINLLTEHPAWSTLRAVCAGHVYVTDGNQYFNRSGPRLVDSAEILAEILFPERIDFGHRNRAWRRV